MTASESILGLVISNGKSNKLECEKMFFDTNNLINEIKEELDCHHTVGIKVLIGYISKKEYLLVVRGMNKEYGNLGTVGLQHDDRIEYIMNQVIVFGIKGGQPSSLEDRDFGNIVVTFYREKGYELLRAKQVEVLWNDAFYDFSQMKKMKYEGMDINEYMKSIKLY